MQDRNLTHASPTADGGGWSVRIPVIAGTVALLFFVPLVLMVVAYATLQAVGVASGRALSLAGLLSVSAAGLWGLLVAVLRVDTKLVERRSRDG